MHLVCTNHFDFTSGTSSLLCLLRTKSILLWRSRTSNTCFRQVSTSGNHSLNSWHEMNKQLPMTTCVSAFICTYTVYNIKTNTLWIIFWIKCFTFMCLSTKCCKNLQRPASFEENKPLNFRILCILIFFAWSGFGKSVKIQHVYIHICNHIA